MGEEHIQTSWIVRAFLTRADEHVPERGVHTIYLRSTVISYDAVGLD